MFWSAMLFAWLLISPWLSSNAARQRLRPTEKYCIKWKRHVKKRTGEHQSAPTSLIMYSALPISSCMLHFMSTAEWMSKRDRWCIVLSILFNSIDSTPFRDSDWLFCMVWLILWTDQAEMGNCGFEAVVARSIPQAVKCETQLPQPHRKAVWTCPCDPFESNQIHASCLPVQNQRLAYCPWESYGTVMYSIFGSTPSKADWYPPNLHPWQVDGFSTRWALELFSSDIIQKLF